MKIKNENFKYSYRPTKYNKISLSKPVPNNYETSLNYWPIGLDLLQCPHITGDKLKKAGIPKGLEQAQKLREEIKKINGIKAVYVDEYEIYIELTSALKWKDISDEIIIVLKSFFKEDTIELIK